jgi:DnaJ-domain-containing protein 1
MSNARIQQKIETSVEISLVDGQVLKGKLFLAAQSRITDVLNDDRAFLPLKTSDGSVVAIAKASIKSVTLPSGSPPSGPYRGSDAYKILGVTLEAGREELKRAYHQLSKGNHPDHIRGLGLGTEYVEVAEKCMSRINVAYEQALKKLDEQDALAPAK